MARHEFDYELETVLPFAQSLIQGLARTEGMRAIGLRKDGELVAAAVYEGFNGQNMWVHLAAVPGCLHKNARKASCSKCCLLHCANNRIVFFLWGFGPIFHSGAL